MFLKILIIIMTLFIHITCLKLYTNDMFDIFVPPQCFTVTVPYLCYLFHYYVPSA